jgi:hypothetical protein
MRESGALQQWNKSPNRPLHIRSNTHYPFKCYFYMSSTYLFICCLLLIPTYAFYILLLCNAAFAHIRFGPLFRRYGRRVRVAKIVTM